MNKTAVIYLRVSTKEQAERGGEIEGFSIPAQRDACLRKAASLGAEVVAQFVDAGESARSADRPELQKMLRFLREQSCDFVVVHKVDRLARNRVDDVTINVAIRKAHAELVSATENIDETPSGMLLHGIMSSIAEIYSQNLANEVLKGMEQKAKTGGTPGKAPLGYLNVRVTTDDGRELRTVKVDPDRAPMITWAFKAYATGDWTLKRLATELERRGLTTRTTPRSPARPIKFNSLHKILCTPYYKGEVTYRGVRYAGRHEPIIDEATWMRVQDVLSSHAVGEKQREHPHYLKSSVFCGICGSRLIVTMSKNRYGDVYPYFICLGRHQKTTDCTQRAVLIPVVEEGVEEEYRHRRLDPGLRDQIEAMLRDELSEAQRSAEAENSQLVPQKERLTNERSRLLQAHYAGAVPLDLLKSEQDRISRQLSEVDARLASVNAEFDQIESALHRALDYAVNGYQAYMRAMPHERRLLNQAFFTRIEVRDDDTDAELAEPFRALLSPEVAHAARRHAESVEMPSRGDEVGESVSLTDILERETNKPAPSGAGLKDTTLVLLMGFKPILDGPLNRCLCQGGLEGACGSCTRTCRRESAIALNASRFLPPSAYCCGAC